MRKIAAATATAGETILLCGNEEKNRTRKVVVATAAAGGTVFLRGNEEQNRTRKVVAATAVAGGPFSTVTTIMPHRFASLALKSGINARRRV